MNVVRRRATIAKDGVVATLPFLETRILPSRRRYNEDE